MGGKLLAQIQGAGFVRIFLAPLDFRSRRRCRDFTVLAHQCVSSFIISGGTGVVNHIPDVQLSLLIMFASVSVIQGLISLIQNTVQGAGTTNRLYIIYWGAGI